MAISADEMYINGDYSYKNYLSSIFLTKKQIFPIIIPRNICFFKSIWSPQFKQSVRCLSSSCNSKGSEMHTHRTKPVDWQYRQPYSHSSIKKRFGYCHF